MIEVPYGSIDWLLREILKGAGDFVVIEPEDAREAVRAELDDRRRGPVGPGAGRLAPLGRHQCSDPGVVSSSPVSSSVFRPERTCGQPP